MVFTFRRDSRFSHRFSISVPQGRDSITGFERCWVFRFVQRYSIESYYVGMLRRFNKEQIEKAWDIERSKLDLWIDSKNVLNTYPITSKELFTAVAQHKVKVNTHSDIILYNRKDIEIILKGGICRYE